MRTELLEVNTKLISTPYWFLGVHRVELWFHCVLIISVLWEPCGYWFWSSYPVGDKIGGSPPDLSCLLEGLVPNHPSIAPSPSLPKRSKSFRNTFSVRFGRWLTPKTVFFFGDIYPQKIHFLWIRENFCGYVSTKNSVLNEIIRFWTLRFRSQEG